MSAEKSRANTTASSELAGLPRSILGSRIQSLADVRSSPRLSRFLLDEPRDRWSACIALTPEEGHGHWELVQVREDYLVAIPHYTEVHPSGEFTPIEDMVQFDFRLSAPLTCRVSRPSLEHMPALRVWFSSQRGYLHIQPERDLDQRRLIISVRPEFMLDTVFPPLGRKTPIPLKSLASAPVGKTCDCQLPIGANMTKFTTGLERLPLQGSGRLASVEQLARQLICEAVDDFSHLPPQPSETYTSREIQALGTVRQFLMEHRGPVPSLNEIAQSVGLKETVLEQGFATVYGETPFNFGLRCSMRRPH